TQFPVGAFDAFAKLVAPRFFSPVDVENTTFDAIIHRICPCIVIAHSASGRPALAAADRRPELVRAVIALEPSGTPEERTGHGTRTLLVWGDYLGPPQIQSLWAAEVAA